MPGLCPIAPLSYRARYGAGWRMALWVRTEAVRSSGRDLGEGGSWCYWDTILRGTEEVHAPTTARCNVDLVDPSGLWSGASGRAPSMARDPC
jgi:hypothetical protein